MDEECLQSTFSKLWSAHQILILLARLGSTYSGHFRLRSVLATVKCVSNFLTVRNGLGMTSKKVLGSPLTDKFQWQSVLTSLKSAHNLKRREMYDDCLQNIKANGRRPTG